MVTESWLSSIIVNRLWKRTFPPLSDIIKLGINYCPDHAAILIACSLLHSGLIGVNQMLRLDADDNLRLFACNVQVWMQLCLRCPVVAS